MSTLLHFQVPEKNTDSIGSTAAHAFFQVMLYLLMFPFRLALCRHPRELSTLRPSGATLILCS